MIFPLALFASAAALADGAGIPKRQDALSKVLIGVPGSVLAADFDGVDFSIVANLTEANTVPSWMAFRAPNLLYTVDENSNNTKLFIVRYIPGAYLKDRARLTRRSLIQ